MLPSQISLASSKGRLAVILNPSYNRSINLLNRICSAKSLPLSFTTAALFFSDQYKMKHLIATVALIKRHHLVHSVELFPSSWCLVILKSTSLVCCSYWHLFPDFPLSLSLSAVFSLSFACAASLSAVNHAFCQRKAFLTNSLFANQHTNTNHPPLSLPLSVVKLFFSSVQPRLLSSSSLLSPCLYFSLPFIHYTALGLWELWSCRDQLLLTRCFWFPWFSYFFCFYLTSTHI